MIHLNPNDIIVHKELFAWEVTNADNFFLPLGKESNPDRVMTLPFDKYPTFEDCKRFIEEELQPLSFIKIYNI